MASVKIINVLNFRAKLKTVDYSIATIRYTQPFGVKVKDELPFRVRFSNIGITSYGENNVPPIGIAVIGFNNYIL
jgi:hypothetical protein